MRIKWLIILSVIFAIIILISLITIQQNNNTALLPEEKNPDNAQLIGYVQPQPLPAIITPAPRILVKSGITLIKDASREPENVIPPAQPERSITAPTQMQNSLSNTATPADTQAGITIINKHPTPKETKEMNSAGVVLY